MTPDAAGSEIICARQLYCDRIFAPVPRMPTLGTEVFANGLTLCAGGGAFIAAATLQALGCPASLIATLPPAPFDAIVDRDIETCGENARLSKAVRAGASPQITVAIGGITDRAFLRHRSWDALPPITAAALSGARDLHIGELSSLREHPELIALAREAGLSISLDCGRDDDVMQGQLGVRSLIAVADTFFPNEAEFDRLTALGLPDKFAKLTVVKCGAAGARALGSAGWLTSASKPVDVVDATGAGGSIIGGFLLLWVEQASLARCLERGNQCGRLAVQAKGGAGAFGAWRALS
jgi:sugar/nucleoside kinase (ribokinase family)